MCRTCAPAASGLDKPLPPETRVLAMPPETTALSFLMGRANLASVVVPLECGLPGRFREKLPSARQLHDRWDSNAARPGERRNAHRAAYPVEKAGCYFPKAFATLSPSFLSTLRQYWNTRSSTGSETSFDAWPMMLLARRSRSASFITSRTSVPA